jgi:hypothetical protein
MQQRAGHYVCATASTLWLIEKVVYCVAMRPTAKKFMYTEYSKEQSIVYVQQPTGCGQWPKLYTVVAMRPTASKFI